MEQRLRPRHRRGAQAALEILEFANSQLLEFRYYDQLLDAELERIYPQLQRDGLAPQLAGRRYTRAARQVHSLFIDVNELDRQDRERAEDCRRRLRRAAVRPCGRAAGAHAMEGERPARS